MSKLCLTTTTLASHHHHHHHHFGHSHSKNQSTEEEKMSKSQQANEPNKTKNENEQHLKTLQQQLQTLVNTVDTNVSKLVDKDKNSQSSPQQLNLGYQNSSITSIYNTTQSTINSKSNAGIGGDGATHASTLSKSQNYSNHCHTNDSANRGIDKSARKKLLIASMLCLLFMIGEAAGGLLANSLAIATDAAHLLTDFASFMISLFAIWMASRPATKKMSFGYYRAEVIGALTSVLLIWVVTGILVLIAVQRLISGDYSIDAPIMLITAGVGVIVNIM